MSDETQNQTPVENTEAQVEQPQAESTETETTEETQTEVNSEAGETSTEE